MSIMINIQCDWCGVVGLWSDRIKVSIMRDRLHRDFGWDVGVREEVVGACKIKDYCPRCRPPVPRRKKVGKR